MSDISLKISIEIDGKTHILTINEAETLYHGLKAIFDKKPDGHIPNYPFYPYQPVDPIPTQPYITWTTDNG